MREIKFRAWDTVSKNWIEYFAITNKDGIVWNEDSEPYCMDEIVVMQFTGLHDKNGKEIYEGDILQHEQNIFPFHLIWEKEQWCEDGFSTGFLLPFTSDQYEIIGNIFENQELLKKKTEC